MLHIFLIILKIIGIILAVLLLLLLLGILLVLFVPLRYRVTVKKGDEGIYGCGKISWLLNIIAIAAEYRDGKLAVKLKIFGIPKAFQPADHKRKKPVKADIAETVPPKKEIVLEEKKVTPPREPVAIEKRTKKWEQFRHKCRAFWEKIKEIWKKIRNIPKKICDCLQKFLKFKLRIQKIWVLLREDGMKLLKLYKGYLFYLWKHLRPRKISGSLHYGFEDPSITGQLTGVIYILLPVSSRSVQILPDFGHTVLEGNLAMKGHIRCFHLLRIGWKVFRDKDLRRFIGKFKS